MHVIAALLLLIVLAAGAVLIYAFFFALWLPAIYFLKVNNKRRSTVFASLLVGSLYLAGIAGLYWHSKRPSVVYERTFGSPPPADVVDLKSATYMFTDSGYVYMQFKCDQATLDSIIASQYYSIDPAPKLLLRDEPRWWNLGAASDPLEYYRGGVDHKGFFQGAMLIYNTETKQANYYWSGID